MLYTIVNGACPRDREKEIETIDGQMYRMREGEAEGSCLERIPKHP